MHTSKSIFHVFFFFNDTATTEIYTLSLHDALPISDLVERLVPRHPGELTGALRTRAAQRMHQPIGMVNTLGIARDLGADHAGGIALQLGAAHPADTGTIDHLDIQRAGRRTIVRTGGMPDVDFGLVVHTPIGTIKSPDSRVHLSAA